MRNSDITKIKTIICKGCDVNAEVSDVYQDTALTWSVKNGHLEVVEFLVGIPECDLDVKDRNHHTALDEALKRYLNAASLVPAEPSSGSVCISSSQSIGVPCDSAKTVTFADQDIAFVRERPVKCGANEHDTGSLKLHLATHFRIIKCLLEAGASIISSTSLDMAVYKVLASGRTFLTKLSKLVAQKGHPHVKSILCSVLVTYGATHDCIKSLLDAGADPCCYLTKEPSRPFMPMENALLLLRVSNDQTLMSRIECDTTGCLNQMGDQEIGQLLIVLRLLVICGHSLQLYVMNFLQERCPGFYMWVTHKRSNPLTLKNLARIKIRQTLKPNVLHCYDSITSIPSELKMFLLLSEWLVPKKASVKFVNV